MERKYVQPFAGALEDFPEAANLPKGAKTVSIEDTFGYTVELAPNVQYAARSGEVQRLQILTPFKFGEHKDYPLVVFVQGSAFHRQPIFQHLQHMVRVCEKGFVVAIVEYRPSEVAPFPAQMEDAKTAVRFLRLNAEKYHIDAQHIAIWGESSGAHTAVMAGITGDGGPDTPLYAEQSARVNCIVDWYSPTDIAAMNECPSMQDHTAPESPEGFLIGQKKVTEHPELTEPTVPMNYITDGSKLPPILIMHGTRDQLVPFEQSVKLYNKLVESGATVEMYCLKGGFHAFGGFNSEKAIELSLDFINRYI